MNHLLHRSHTLRSLQSFMSTSLFALMLTLMTLQAHAFFIGPVEIQIVDRNSAQLPSYDYEGQHYIMGRYNQRYMLRVINHSSERYELVMTVDGRDVVNGSAGSFSHRGYVVDPHHSFNVEGFRSSSSSVAAFRFTTPGDSYAGRMGAGENTGVIGVALFSERHKPRYYPQQRYRESATNTGGYGDLEAVGSTDRSSVAPSAGLSLTARRSRAKSKPSAQERKSELGTRYGERVHSEIEETRFVRRSSSPDQTLVITYDSERGLRRRGVISTQRPISPRRPSPFPNESRFAPPPPGY